MRLPKSFNDLTVEKYQQVFFLLQDKQTDDLEVLSNWARIISILSDKPIEKIEALPSRELKNLIKRIDFILRPEALKEKVKPLIAVNGKAYKAILDAGQISTSQAMDIKELQKPVEDLNMEETTVANMDKLLASIYLPLTIRGFKYRPNKHQKVANDMKKAKVGDIYGTLFFYSVLYENLMKTTQDSMSESAQVLAEHLKDLESWIKSTSSEKDGDGKSPSTNYQGVTHSLRKSFTHGPG